MYAIHIHSSMAISALEGLVPFTTWYGRKPDMSHFRIFGSTCYANIPKKLCGRKLKETSIKCCMLRWWADETKGYRLEELETGKLITSCDVQFVEDDSATDLAVVET